MQAGGLLLGDEFGDGLVLDRLERCGIDFAGGEILTRGLELGRAEIGATTSARNGALCEYAIEYPFFWESDKYLVKVTRTSRNTGRIRLLGQYSCLNG